MRRPKARNDVCSRRVLVWALREPPFGLDRRANLVHVTIWRATSSSICAAGLDITSHTENACRGPAVGLAK